MDYELILDQTVNSLKKRRDAIDLQIESSDNIFEKLSLKNQRKEVVQTLDDITTFKTTFTTESIIGCQNAIKEILGESK